MDESKLRSVLAAAKAELAARQKRKTDRLTRYRDDPVGFVELGLLGTLWSKQREICNAVRDHRMVSVRSCHDIGKSRVAADIAAWWISVHDPGEAFVITLAPTGHQVKSILWREIARVHRDGNLPGRLTQTEWKLSIGDTMELVGMGRSPKDTDPTAIQGIHQLRVLVIFDEACGIAKALWDAASSLVANEFSRFLAIGNPDDPSTEFAAVCKPGSGWHTIGISAFESPNFTGEDIPEFLKPLLISKVWVEERKRKWGESSPVYRSKVLGQFPEQAADGLIPYSSIVAAVARGAEEGLDYAGPNEIGVDVARFGDDNTSVYHRRGITAKCVARYNGNDTMHTVGVIARLIDETGAEKCRIDDVGVGGGVTDRLRELKATEGRFANCEIIAVNVGEAPTINTKDARIPQTERYKNLRAQVNWMMRERFISGRIALIDNPDLPEQFDDIQDQAGDIHYYMTSRGQIQIESKEDMKDRGRSSPDDWDALVLAYADDVNDPGTPFFATEKFAVNGAPVPMPPRLDSVFAVISTGIKTGKTADSVGVVYFGRRLYVGQRLTIIDWDIAPVDAALMDGWFRGVFTRLDALGVECKAAAGSLGVFIQNKDAGTVLLRQGERRHLPVIPIEDTLAKLGKNERAMGVSGYIEQGMVKIAGPAFEKSIDHRGQTRNHLLDQTSAFRIDAKEEASTPTDLLNCLMFGIALALGNAEGS